MAFSDNLKQRREQCGLSQQELAQVLGISQAAVSDFERGKKLPAIDVALKMSEVLCTTCDELMNCTQSKA